MRIDKDWIVAVGSVNNDGEWVMLVLWTGRLDRPSPTPAIPSMLVNRQTPTPSRQPTTTEDIWTG